MEAGMQDLLPALQSEMELASSREEFERAARIRDQIESFEKAQRSTQGNLSDELDGDFIAISDVHEFLFIVIQHQIHQCICQIIGV